MQSFLDKDIWSKICTIIFIALVQISWNWGGMSDGEAALANFTKRFNKEISKEYGLFLFGSGAAFPVKIEEIILSYQANYCENIIGARKLAVEITHKMIDRMNQDANLLKYLANSPASLKNVSLTIGFKDPNNGETGVLDSVMVIGMRNNVVFNTYNETKTMLNTLHKETFDEAEKIITQGSLYSSINDNPIDL